MPNITMTIEDDVLIKARKLAVEKHTTVTAMVRDYLQRLAARENQKKEAAIAELGKCFNNSGLIVGPRKWTREDLHDR